MEKLQPARLELVAYDTPYSATYDDVYHSALGGPAQDRHVFLAGNELPQRWQGRHRFVILETGFGLGLTFLAAWQAWRVGPQRCQRLHFISVEKHPFALTDLITAQIAWPEFVELATELQQHWPALTPGMHRLYLNGGQVILTLLFGDATTQMRAVDASVDAFFLDGFSPVKNPELWIAPLLQGAEPAGRAGRDAGDLDGGRPRPPGAEGCRVRRRKTPRFRRQATNADRPLPLAAAVEPSHSKRSIRGS